MPSKCINHGRVAFCFTLASSLWLAGNLHASYIFQDIVNPGDTTFNQEFGINNVGAVSGYFGSGQMGHPNQGYTVAPPGYSTFTSENFPGSVQTQVVGIDNSGATVGFWSNTNTGTDANFGFTDVGGTFTSVNDPSTPAGGLPVNQLLGINDNGVAAGFYVDGSGNPQGYLYHIATQTFTPLTVSGANNSTATGIDNSGVISGFYNNGTSDVAFIDNAGAFSFFQAFGDSTQFFGINNTGYAVGTYQDGSGQFHGVLYNIATQSFQSIDDPLAAAGAGNGATLNGINNQDQLVGFYANADGNTIGLLATSIPEPATVEFVGLALLVTAFGRKLKLL